MIMIHIHKLFFEFYPKGEFAIYINHNFLKIKFRLFLYMKY